MSGRHNVVYRIAVSLAAALITVWWTAHARAQEFRADLLVHDTVQVTRMEDALRTVLTGDQREQARFASVAIEMMADFYRTELAQSRKIVPDAKSRSSSWGSGMRRYIAQLEKIALSIDDHTDIKILKEPHGAIRILVGEEQVMLSAPRPDRQATFEQAIADNVCRYIECPASGNTVEEKVANRSTRKDGGWAFRSDAPPMYSSSDGLHCVFSDSRHFKLKKAACHKLLDEIRLLTESLIALKTHGMTIDWNSIKIDQVGIGEPHRVRYNGRRAFVRISLPGLMRAEAVLQESIPWIRANLHGRVYQHVVKLPDNLVYLNSTRES
ncbi:MAG: hypothetical protein ACI915_001759 [Gammaproteobacteria bacterium]|jgi:hypothetical protein